MSPPNAGRRPGQGRRPNPPGATTATRLQGSALPPALTAKAATAVAALVADRRRTICAAPHIRRAAIALVCAAHPAAGIMCLACAENHARRHGRTFERQCDCCGAVVPEDVDIFGAGVIHRSSLIEARDRRGRRGLVFGDLLVYGLGACVDCAEIAA